MWYAILRVLHVAVVQSWHMGHILHAESLVRAISLGGNLGPTVVFSTVMPTTKLGMRPDVCEVRGASQDRRTDAFREGTNILRPLISGCLEGTTTS